MKIDKRIRGYILPVLFFLLGFAFLEAHRVNGKLIFLVMGLVSIIHSALLSIPFPNKEELS